MSPVFSPKLEGYDQIEHLKVDNCLIFLIYIEERGCIDFLVPDPSQAGEGCISMKGVALWDRIFVNVGNSIKPG